MDGLARISRARAANKPLLLLFLGSSIGNLSRAELPGFLQKIRSHLRQGDYFLLEVDLVKEVDRMLAAYDDPTGVTAAFNLNLLGRMNRELDANFDLAFLYARSSLEFAGASHRDAPAVPTQSIRPNSTAGRCLSFR